MLNIFFFFVLNEEIMSKIILDISKWIVINYLVEILLY